MTELQSLIEDLERERRTTENIIFALKALVALRAMEQGGGDE
ncbi:hypothetical protein [Aquisalinus luteolus]|uniref:Uncharacterized protein n=1 Tax=Aquisalinus luteolus TaxID=1566827 RepID=A0A8J3ES74_9PROT|nr:hypothetical protein [Aquisalinus luteolus]GGI00158.1 hypothetical protein GCM10011355_27790 [Aquisalinus luteolus]